MSTPTNVKVKKAKAADPGFAFELELDNNGQPINDTLQVQVKVWDMAHPETVFTSLVQIQSNIQETNLYFVVPFGDSNYEPSQTMQFQVHWAVPSNAGFNSEVLTGIVFGEGGHFDLVSSNPDNIPTGGALAMNGTIRSLDNNFTGIMQGDGNFCVYQQYNDTVGATGLICTDSSASYGNGTGCSLRVVAGRVILYNSNGAPIAASPDNPSDPNGSLVIDSNGHFAIRSANGNVTRISINPNNLSN